MCCPVAHYDSGIRSSSDKSIRYDDMAENKLLSIGQGGWGTMQAEEVPTL